MSFLYTLGLEQRIVDAASKTIHVESVEAQ
jgi:hypothetical protein